MKISLAGAVPTPLIITLPLPMQRGCHTKPPALSSLDRVPGCRWAWSERCCGLPAGGHEVGIERRTEHPGEHQRTSSQEPGAEPEPGPAGQSDHSAEVRASGRGGISGAQPLQKRDAVGREQRGRQTGAGGPTPCWLVASEPSFPHSKGKQGELRVLLLKCFSSKSQR